MQFSNKYRQRAVELYKEGTAKETFQRLRNEFPNLQHPDERTLRRWSKDQKTAEALKQVTLPNNEPSDIKTVNLQRLNEHFDQLASVAETILESLSGLKRINEDEYEFDRVEDRGLLIPLTISRK